MYNFIIFDLCIMVTKLRQLSLLQSAMDSYYKLRQLFYYKVRHGLLQIATGITKCDDYYKLRQYSVSSYIQATLSDVQPKFLGLFSGLSCSNSITLTHTQRTRLPWPCCKQNTSCHGIFKSFLSVLKICISDSFNEKRSKLLSKTNMKVG